MKRMLLVALFFPPRNHIAGYRSGCFAKFLPENGWLPTVLCEDWPQGSPNYDPHFVGVLPDEVTVHRVLVPKPRGFRERFWLRKAGQYLWPHRVPLLWSERAREKLHQLLAREKFDAVWATSDPMAPLALAEEAATRMGVPWIADIRDSYNVQHFGKWYKRPLFARQERALCRRASLVTTVSEGLARGLGRRIGRDPVVIHNGFDPTLLPAAPVERRSKFTIVYSGCLILPARNPAPVLQAVETCLQRGLIPRDEMEVLFYGAEARMVEESLPGALERLPVRVLPRVPHQEILRIQMASAVLLLLAHAGEKGVLTGKAFDYLACGRPILAVPHDQGAIADLLQRTGAGVALTEPETIVRQLADWYQDWKAGRDQPQGRRESEIARYSRREQTKQLAGLLNELTRR